MNCPKCNTPIKKDNINIHTDLGQCSECGHVFKISSLFTTSSNYTKSTFDINEPPKGAWIQQDMKNITIGATTRSPIAFFLVPFMCVWSGGSLGGIYGTQIISGEFSLFMSLFGIPFLLGSIFFWSIALMAIAGKVEARLDKYGGTIFTGLGKIGIKKKFRWDEVSVVSEGRTNLRYPGSTGAALHLEGQKRIAFGRGLKESRRYYMMKSIETVMHKIHSRQSLI